MKRVHKFLAGLLVVILAFGVALAVCWDMVQIYLMPRSVVTNAIKTVYAQLQQRFDGNPMLLAASYLDENGKQSADVELFASDQVLGDLRYEMQIQTQPGYIQGTGTVYTGQKDLELSVYADSRFMAVSSQDLLQGSYYGITYDTFLEDVRRIPLLSWMIGDTVLQKWNQNICSIQKRMEAGYPILQIPKLEEKDLQIILPVLATAHVEVEKVAIELQNQMLDCHRVSFEVAGESIQRIMQMFANIESPETASASAAFYMNEGSLVLLNANLDAGDIQYEVRMELGQNSLYDPVVFSLCSKAGTADPVVIRFSGVCEEEKREDQWHIAQGTDRKDFFYAWDAASGDMLLRIDDGEPFALNLTQTESGLSIYSDNLSGIYRAVIGQQNQYGKVYSGVVTVRKGSNIVIPQYKNLDQWSMEDFLILLEGIGSLIGLEFS